MEHPRSIAVLDFGGQYAHLIARRVRQCGVFSEILPADTPIESLKDVAGIILSGGPTSVTDPDSPKGDPAMFTLGVPILGICYGLQWMTQTLGGTVESGHIKEYGHTDIRMVGESPLFLDCGQTCTVWMSHGDEASVLPPGFTRIATSDACSNAAFADEERRFYAVQFHPEVTHSQHGQDILRRFVAMCDAAPWSIESYAKHVGQEILEEVGDRKVFMLVSGGVDSTVAFTLLNEALGQGRVQGLLVDTGLMRKDEVGQIERAFDRLGITNLRIENAAAEFFAALQGKTEPEDKRRAIGDTFLAVQKRISQEMGLSQEDGWMLGQGTIYPDTIETGGTAHADQIKTHHNRVEAIQEMIEQGLVIEPLKELYKDEVRLLGEELGLPHELVWRHPFPGPGLGVRILCADQPVSPTEPVEGLPENSALLPVQSVGVQGDGRTYRQALAVFQSDPYSVSDTLWRQATDIPNRYAAINRVLLCTSHTEPLPLMFAPRVLTPDRADILREADAIVDREMRREGLYEDIWQFPVILAPFGTTDTEESIVLRPVESQEAMTARAIALSPELLKRITERLLQLDGVGMVFLDLTHKPPGTIEWE